MSTVTTLGVTQLRTETKYLADAGEAAAVRRAIERHAKPRLFDGRGPVWTVSTLYCDFADGRLMRAVVAAPDRNTKVRVRAYAPADGGGPPEGRRCFVEVKIRNRMLSRKHRFACDPAAVLPLLSDGVDPPGAGSMDAKEREALAALRGLRGDAPLAPVLLARYRRVIYPEGGGDWRVNFDEDVRIGRPGPVSPQAAWWLDPPEGEVVYREPKVIVEFKSTGAIPSWLREALQALSPAEYSKVHRGARAVVGAGG